MYECMYVLNRHLARITVEGVWIKVGYRELHREAGKSNGQAKLSLGGHFALKHDCLIIPDTKLFNGCMVGRDGDGIVDAVVVVVQASRQVAGLLITAQKQFFKK